MQQFQQQDNNDGDNKPKFTHELVAGAAAYYAADKYEEHCEANGKNSSIMLPLSWFDRICSWSND